MNLVELLNGLLAQINALQSQLADAAASAEQLRKEGFDEGFAAGVASASDKVFSQAEADEMVASAVAPLQSELEALRGAFEQGKLEAVASFKSEIKAKYEEMQVAESAAEVGFGELLN